MENTIGFVYKITNPNGRIYVGSTIDIKRRKYQYKKNYFKAQIKIHRSIEKYGWEKHQFDIIWEGNHKEMLKNEAIMGYKLNVLADFNLNLRLPKLDSEPYCFSKEARLKMSNSAKGKIISKETRMKISNFHSGKITSSITRQKMSNSQTGKKMSFISKQKMSEAKKGKPISIETKMKISNFHSKSILQFDLQNNLIKEWKSAAEAAKVLFLHASHIRNCCLNKRKTHANFIWKNNLKNNK